MTRVLCAGLGLIGIEVVRTALDHPAVDLVAAVDVSPALAGRSLTEVVGKDALGLVVAPSLEAALEETRPDVVLLSTSSRLEAIAPQVLAALDVGAAVVTTCEELSCPWDRPEADAIAEAARRAGRGVLGTGVNPGFVMDLIPALLGLPCTRVDSILVERTVDLRRRRDALRAKAGVGMTVEEFEALAAVNGIGHVGLDCSARLVAFAFGSRDAGWPAVSIEPLVNGDMVCGFRQRVGYPGGDGAPSIELRLEMSMSPVGEADRFVIEGEPSINAVFEGGVFGDSATAALVVNAIPLVLAAPGNLHTVLDIPALRAWKPVVH
jgi:4-hydroxy-tetrahydrodipicolinate reductase